MRQIRSRAELTMRPGAWKMPHSDTNSLPYQEGVFASLANSGHAAA